MDFLRGMFIKGPLPKHITCLTLRRTFGSLLLRSGKTYTEIAAAMGNTPEVARKHYAKLEGCEVEIDF